MRLRFLLLLLLTCISFSATCLTIGILPFNPPFEMQVDKNKNFTGFDIDLMLAICQRIQTECNFVPLSAEQLFIQTLSGKIDIAISAISITTQRAQNYLFSLPYLASSGQFLTNSSSTINRVNDIRNKRVGTEKGSLFKALALEIFNNEATVVEYANQPEIFQALNNNNIDAILLDTEGAKYWAANNDNQYRLVGKNILIGIGYGIMANKTEQSLINQINAALLQIESDGTYLTIYNRYFSQLFI